MSRKHRHKNKLSKKNRKYISSHKVVNGKHNSLCEKLADTIRDRYQYNSVTTNEEYQLGETDVLAITDTREVYYEIKSATSDKSIDKAIKQLLRWTHYKYSHDKSKNYYGVYYRPGKIELICKNGELRK